MSTLGTDSPSGSGRIVVGVDGSPHSEEAPRWAIRHGRLTGQAVEAVTSWGIPVNVAVGPLTDFDWEGMASRNAALSIRGDEAEESWRIVGPVLAAWAAGRVPLEEYAAGSDGPSARAGDRSTT